MADQTQRLEIATVRAEVGSNIVFRFANDAANADSIPTQSGDIQNLKQVVLEIQQDAAEKISISTTIYATVAAGLAATADQGIFLVQSNDADEIYTVWQNQGGTAVNTGKTALSATAIQTALDASNEAAQAAEQAADTATLRTAGFLAPAAEPPVLRDNGLPLQEGDRYFNTLDQSEYIFKSSGWTENESIEAINALEQSLASSDNPSGGAARVAFKQSGIGAASRTSLDKLRERITVKDFGAIGDGTLRTVSEWISPSAGAWASTLEQVQVKYPHVTSADDLIDWAATQAAINHIRSLPYGGKVVFNCGGQFTIDKEIDCFPSVAVELEWEEGSVVLTTLLGAASVLFSGTHKTNPSIRGKRLTYTNPSIEFHSSIPFSAIGCVFIEKRYASNLKFQGNRGSLLHYRYNTALRASALYNCDAAPVSIWGAGIQKPWKVNSAARYSIISGTTLLSSDVDVFDSGDVGKVLTLQGGGLGQRFTISSYTGPRSVTVSSVATATFSAIGGNFETIRGSMSASSSTLTMEKSCLLASDVGRVVYVLNARNGFPAPALTPLRATIISVESDTVCTLSVQSQVAASLTPVVFSPGVELYGEPGESSNDFAFDGLHTEEMRGTNLVVTDAVNVSLTNLKLHAYNNYYSTSATQFRGVFSSVSGHISGDFEGTCNNALGDVHISGQSGLLTFDKMTGVMSNDGCLIYAENNAAGSLVSVGDWGINNPGVTAKSMNNAFRIVGSGDLYQVGHIAAYAVNYTRPDIVKRKTVFGKNPPALIGLMGIASDSSHPRMDLIAAGPAYSPQIIGIAYGGTLDAPTDAADFQTTLSIKGQINIGSGIVDGAGILFRARSPVGNDSSSDMLFYTRSGGSYSSRWSIATTGGLLPISDNSTPIGSGSARISQLYAGTATINTSDEREKIDIAAIPDAVLDAWAEVDYQQFRFVDAVAEKSEGARLHVGVIAQRVKEAFERNGINPMAVLCHDAWSEEHEVIETWEDEVNDEGELIRPAGSMIVRPYRAAGDRYGIRYEEALALEAALMRRTTQRLEARLSALESI